VPLEGGRPLAIPGVGVEGAGDEVASCVHSGISDGGALRAIRVIVAGDDAGRPTGDPERARTWM
jgi:hypothetical protein